MVFGVIIRVFFLDMVELRVLKSRLGGTLFGIVRIK